LLEVTERKKKTILQTIDQQKDDLICFLYNFYFTLLIPHLTLILVAKYFSTSYKELPATNNRGINGRREQ
jgi:hypothetical protein